MTDPETARLIVWNDELRRAHSRLREALRVARAAAPESGDPTTAGRDLVLHCRGFCSALGAHHGGEDRALFPAIEAAHPELAPVLRSLEQDHSMIDVLLTALDAAVSGGADADAIDRHLDGIAAIMESHFAYEERRLLTVLDTLALRQDPAVVLGPVVDLLGKEEPDHDRGRPSSARTRRGGHGATGRTSPRWR